MYLKSAILGCACAVLWGLPAAAQQRPPASPADPQTKVAPPQYQSAFTGYRPLRDEKPAPWREVNDEVARVGGHLGIVGGAGHAGHAQGAGK